jgi:hypothetical protein
VGGSRYDPEGRRYPWRFDAGVIVKNEPAAGQTPAAKGR